MKTIRELILAIVLVVVGGFGTAAFAGCWNSIANPAYVLVPAGNWACTEPRMDTGWSTLQVLSSLDPTMLTGGGLVPPGIDIKPSDVSTGLACGNTTITNSITGSGVPLGTYFTDYVQLPFQAAAADASPFGSTMLGVFYVGNSYVSQSPYYGFPIAGAVSSTGVMIPTTNIFNTFQPDDYYLDPTSPGLSPCYDSNHNCYWAFCVSN